ncbi:MAG: hypothetical protein JRF50_17380 [Deltaproteobacteria bacterium]|nr:hypothetical protein [Deltaproteobacteria bacterium]
MGITSSHAMGSWQISNRSPEHTISFLIYSLNNWGNINHQEALCEASGVISEALTEAKKRKNEFSKVKSVANEVNHC